MRTLRDVWVFVGIPEDSPDYGYPTNISLRVAGNLLESVSPGPQNRSLRGIDGLIDGLGPITLEASLLSSRGVEPFDAVIRIVASPGCVIHTHIFYDQNGQFPFESTDYGAAGGDFDPTTLGPGTWNIVVRRTGITDTGFERLEKSFTALVSRHPSPPPPPPPPPVRPHIDVTQSGPVSAVKYQVTGSGFLPNQPNSSQGVAVRAVDGVDIQDWALIYTGSDGGGKISLSLGPLDTGTLSRNAAGQAIVNFSATDKRTDPSSVPAGQPLYSNTVTFRY